MYCVYEYLKLSMVRVCYICINKYCKYGMWQWTLYVHVLVIGQEPLLASKGCGQLSLNKLCLNNKKNNTALLLVPHFSDDGTLWI